MESGGGFLARGEVLGIEADGSAGVRIDGSDAVVKGLHGRRCRIGTVQKDIRDHVRQHLAAYKVPKYVFFVDEYPLTASGKIQKFKLREMSKTLVEQRRANPA